MKSKHIVRFNEAAAVMPRKRSVIVPTAVAGAVSLQGGRGSDAAEELPLASSASTRSARLQGGRGSDAAEEGVSRPRDDLHPTASMRPRQGCRGRARRRLLSVKCDVLLLQGGRGSDAAEEQEVGHFHVSVEPASMRPRQGCRGRGQGRQ